MNQAQQQARHLTDDLRSRWATYPGKAKELLPEECRVRAPFVRKDPPDTWEAADSLQDQVRTAIREEQTRQREVRLIQARARHEEGAGRPVTANYKHIKGEGAPPVTLLPDR